MAGGVTGVTCGMFCAQNDDLIGGKFMGGGDGDDVIGLKDD